MKNLEERVWYMSLLGVAILLFPVTMAILLVIVIAKIRMWFWCRKHCVYLSPEKMMEDLRAKGLLKVTRRRVVITDGLVAL